MKRRDLIRHLERNGCVLMREGHSHSIYENSANGHRTPVPRHREIPGPLVRAICRQLSIPVLRGQSGCGWFAVGWSCCGRLQSCVPAIRQGRTFPVSLREVLSNARPQFGPSCKFEFRHGGWTRLPDTGYLGETQSPADSHDVRPQETAEVATDELESWIRSLCGQNTDEVSHR